MSWLLSLVIALISAVLGGFCGFLVGARCVRWYRISSFEGASGYFVVGLALVGIVAGFAIGLTASRIVAGRETATFLQQLGAALASVGGVTGLIALLAWLPVDHPPKIKGRELILEIEIKTPAGADLPRAGEQPEPFARIELMDSRRQPSGRVRLQEARQEDGRWIIPAEVFFATSTKKQKFLHVHFNADQNLNFALPMRGRPRERHMEWSQWSAAGWPTGEPPPQETDQFLMRSRVQLEPIPPPPPTAAEIAAADEARLEAEFQAVAVDAPLTEWLRWTPEWVPAHRRSVALAAIRQRPNFVAEFAHHLRTESPDVAADVMRVLPLLPEPVPEVIPAIEEVGHAIAERIRQFNAHQIEGDPGYDLAYEADQLFGGWMAAVRDLRERAGADFTRQLHEILLLARVRPDSQAMRTDVVRVASYYLHQWAGIEPLPTDPKPR
jgi:hypothetical protein